jgi:isoleucyl-tRNA synthetase
MSKKLKNYPDPLEIINKYGSDCLRLYLSKNYGCIYIQE